MSIGSVPTEAETIRSLLNVSSILALVFGIIWIIVGAFTLIFLVGIIFIVFGIVDFIIYVNIKSIIDLVETRRYGEAKDKTLVWTVIGFIFGGVIVGVLMLIAYLKFDELIRRAGPAPPPPPPPP